VPKIFILSDSGVPSGYGRIADEIGTRLKARNYEVMAASLQYDGLLPPMHEGAPLPYWVGSLAGHPDWLQKTVNMIGAWGPDLVLSIQDFPYHEQLYNSGLDWSQYGRILITPVDGVPIFPAWLDTLAKADEAFTISRFGKQAFAKAGHEVGLCIPGVNLSAFYKMRDDERAELRKKLGIEEGAFVVGTVAMNQGRKCISLMLRAFFEFAQDKPKARYLVDMDAVSPAGWDIPQLCKSFGWDESKLIYKHQALAAGLFELRERYNVMDAHMVISHREGYGLPLVEAMACGVVSMALDYCSGTEIVSGRGCLIKPIPYSTPGTWGNAEDKYPDMDDLKAQLQRLYEDAPYRAQMAEAGMAWARTQTWDAAADNVIAGVERVLKKRAPLLVG
jgi:glycosyltransferase involved in cell wall biosynthesis